MVISSSMFGIFQSICKAHIPLLLMICSVGVKLLLNPILISIPELNITGAAVSSAVGYLLMALLGAFALNKCLPAKVSILKAVVPPAICGIICGASAYFIYLLLNEKVNNILSVLISIGFGAIIYVILLIFTGIFRTSGIIKRKKQKKFQKPLAKSTKIG